MPATRSEISSKLPISLLFSIAFSPHHYMQHHSELKKKWCREYREHRAQALKKILPFFLNDGEARGWVYSRRKQAASSTSQKQSSVHVDKAPRCFPFVYRAIYGSFPPFSWRSVYQCLQFCHASSLHHQQIACELRPDERLLSQLRSGYFHSHRLINGWFPSLASNVFNFGSEKSEVLLALLFEGCFYHWSR